MPESVRLPQRLSELKGDTNIISPNSGDALLFNSSQGKWVPSGISVTNSVDVLTTTGDLLYFSSIYRRLSVGASGTFLNTYGSIPQWSYITEANVSGLVSDLSNKVSSSRLINTSYPLSGGGDLTGNLSLSINQATSSTSGYLSSVDWQAFNAKIGSTRTISTTYPLQGGGDLSSDRTLSILPASISASGFISLEDWTLFVVNAYNYNRVNLGGF